jgi:SAM-dependent methyltransferase
MELNYSYQYRKYHDGSAADSAAAVAYFKQKLLLVHLPVARDGAVLDVGCGTGHCLLALKELGFQHPEGFDADAGQVADGKKMGLQITHVPVQALSDFVATRLGRFGLVTMLSVLEHVPKGEQIGFLRQVGRMLAPDGRLVCEVPNADSVAQGRYRYADWTHETSFTSESLDFVLYHAGFQVKDIVEDNPNPAPRGAWRPRPWLRWLYRCTMRGLRRLELGAELGMPLARRVPLSKNIIATAVPLGDRI